MTKISYKEVLRKMRKAMKSGGEDFSQETIDKAWKRSGGHCECTRQTCGHNYRCNKLLNYSHHSEGEIGAWQAHHKVAKASGGLDIVSNCEILCLECHKNTKTYGTRNS